MADLTRGKTFASTETVTNTKLHTLVDSATIANIVSADFDLTTTNPIHIGTSAPSDSNSKFWYDTTNNLFLIKDAGGTFQPSGKGAEYTNKSGASLSAGDVVTLDTSNAQAVKTTTSATDTDAWGVAASSAANDAVVYIITEGLAPAVTVTGATSIGDYLYTSTTAKKADPASSKTSGAFGRALTSDSASVVAQIFGDGAAVDIPASDTFEMEAGREATVSTTFGTPTTVTFGTAFAEPPIIVCTAESTSSSDQVTVIKSTTTNFTAYGNTANAFNWVAVTAGIFEVKSGVIVQGGTVASNGSTASFLNAYQTGKTPAIACSYMMSDDNDTSNSRLSIYNRLLGGETSSNLNFAGRSSMIFANSTLATAGNGGVFILVSQTDAVKTGNAATATGSQDTINTLSFEAGVVVEVTSATPTLTFETAFSAAPAVLVSGESRSDSLAGISASANLNAVPTTTGFTGRDSTDARGGYNWIAFEKGHTTLSTAKRLG